MKTQKPRKPRTKMSPIERSIRSREHGIAKLKLQKVNIARWAEQDIAKVDRKIAEREIILNAIKAGSLK
jgi:hypothetical protein